MPDLHNVGRRTKLRVNPDHHQVLAGSGQPRHGPAHGQLSHDEEIKRVWFGLVSSRGPRIPGGGLAYFRFW